jgi:hypothetical protein
VNVQCLFGIFGRQHLVDVAPQVGLRQHGQAPQVLKAAGAVRVECWVAARTLLD